jgi:Holliday junction resolvasome RuvABC DNA-binding subunit
MFSHVTGTILDIENSRITIEIRGTGLGLEVFLSPQALGLCTIGGEISIPLHHHITEAGQTLF